MLCLYTKSLAQDSDRRREKRNSPHKELRHRAFVLLAQSNHRWVPHTHGSSQGRIRLDDDTVPGAGLADGDLRVERMHLDLVDRRRDPRFRGHKLIDLDALPE